MYTAEACILSSSKTVIYQSEMNLKTLKSKLSQIIVKQAGYLMNRWSRR